MTTNEASVNMSCPVCNKPLNGDCIWCVHRIGKYEVFYDNDGTMLLGMSENGDVGNAARIKRHIVFEDEAHTERLLMLK